MSTIYPGRIVEMTDGGPKVMVPALARDATWGPVSTIVAGLQLGDQVAVTNLGDSRDTLIILGRMGGITGGDIGVGIDDVTGLRPELDAIDVRVDALQIDQNTDEGILTEHGGRLDDLDAGQLTQNNRLTAVEGVNATQTSRLDGIDSLNTTQNNRLTATEGVANGAASTASAAQTAAGTAQTAANSASTAVGTLRTDTAGKVTTKGDLLAATGSGVLARQAVGGNGLALVADSSTATGLAYAERRGQPLGTITGATTATRYVGGTAGGPPASGGPFIVGDWIVDRTTADVWVCTAAGSPGTWACRTDARLDAQEAFGNHHWFQTGGSLPNGGAEVPISGFTPGAGNASIATISGGEFIRLNRAGRWSIFFSVFSDLVANRYTQAKINWPGGPMVFDDILQSDHAQAGPYPGCGISHVRLGWAGWVNAAQALQPFHVLMLQGNSSGVALNHDYRLHVNYLGGA